LCALDLLSGERREVWLADAIDPPCPFQMAADECFIFFAADADIGIFLSYGWTIPRHVINGRVEFIKIWNGDRPLTQFSNGNLDIAAEKETKADKKRRKKPGMYSLARICRHFRIPFISDEEKGDWRDLALRPGRNFTLNEQEGLIRYCRSDVDATAALALRIWDTAELSDRRTFNQALIRGFYMSGAAWVRHVGLPIDMPLHRRLSSNASRLRATYIERNAHLDVYEKGKFNFKKFGDFLQDQGLLATWPRTAKGRLATSGKILETIAEEHKIIEELFLFRATIDVLEGIGSSFNDAGEIEEDEDKAKGLQLCPDGRSRASLLPFGTKTGRNSPRGRQFVGTNPAWMWSLVKPESGRAVAILDFIAQELRIAAILSGDAALGELAANEDPHMEMAISFNLAPRGAIKKSHSAARKIGKTLGLAMLYAGGPRMVDALTKVGRPRAVDLHRQLRARFATFFEWSDRFAYRGLSAAPIWTPLGWRFWPRYWKDGEPPDRTCRNFIIQGGAADILRVVTIRAFEAGIRICALVHDSIVIEAAIGDIDRVAEEAHKIMVQATIDIIGAPISVDCKITRYPDRVHDDDGEEDFNMLMGMHAEIEGGQGTETASVPPSKIVARAEMVA
jgi:hypothetical protein